MATTRHAAVPSLIGGETATHSFAVVRRGGAGGAGGDSQREHGE
jgi:hypothetical protein